VALLAPAYRPRRPTETVLYRVVRSHLETFLAHARDSYEAPVPRYVEQELRGYLRCGVFAHGFVRARCDTCGHDLLVAFSCKHRGVCPSCAGRRMANTAAHLVDRVMPAVPVRQWVLSLPFELRTLAAFRAEALSALARIFVESVFARHRAWARRKGLAAAPSGALTFVQRFGSSMNLNVPFHTTVLDGVFRRDAEGRPVFHAAPPPTREELEAAVRRVHRNALAWLERRGLLLSGQDAGAGSQEPAAQTFLDACAAIAMQRGAVRPLPDDHAATVETGPADAQGANDSAVEFERFNLQASVRVDGDDDLGRERLLRYGARPALALDRLRQLPGGKIAYRIKKLRGGRAKPRVITPLEFLARLAAVVLPPPRYPPLRYHGVLGPRSAWRRDIVPKPPSQTAPRVPPAATEKKKPACGAATSQQRARETPTGPPAKALTVRVAHASGMSPATVGSPPAVLVSDSARANAVLLSPNILSVKHWNRLLDGLLYAATPRVEWATLLRRSFDVDAFSCARCGGRLRVLGEVTDPAMVRRILESLGLPTEAPVAARARDPTELVADPDVN